MENNAESYENATPRQIGAVNALDEMIEKIIKDADDYAASLVTSNETVNRDENDHMYEERLIMSQALVTRVLGDAFHVMDRVKVPMHHDLKSAYFQALRAAIFFLDAGDMTRVKGILEKKGKK